MNTHDYIPFGKRCHLCGQYFEHDGQLVYPDLRPMVFDEQGRHVAGIGKEPMQGWHTDNGVCVPCLTNLGVISDADER